MNTLTAIVNKQQNMVNEQHKKVQVPIGDETSYSLEDFFNLLNTMMKNRGDFDFTIFNV